MSDRRRKPVIRCSQLPQLLECGASRVLMPLVKPRDGGEGHEGTYGHWMTACRLIQELGAVPPPGGLAAPAVPAGYKFPAMSGWLVDFFFSLIKHGVPADHSLMVEQPFAYEFDRFILSGHVDAVSIDAPALFATGWDWKLGYKPVAPANCNSQGLGYIVLKKRAWPTLQQVRFTFGQPRNDPTEGFERVTTTEVEGAALDRCVTYLEEQVNEALDRADEVNSGMLQCAWCPVGIQCPAIQAEIHDMKLKLTPEMLARIKREADDATLGDMVIAARTVAKAIEDAEDLLHARIDANKAVTSGSGVTITRKTEGGHYTVTDPVAMYDTLRGMMPPTQLAKALNYPVTRIKDAIADVMDIPKGGKAAITATTVFDAKLRPFLEQGEKRILVFN